MDMEIEPVQNTLLSPSPRNRPKPGKKDGSKKFKNFTLNRKNLFEEFTDQQKSDLLRAPGKKINSPQDKPTEDKNAFVTTAIAESQKSTTSTGGLTFSSSGDPRVDFYFHVMEQVDSDETKKLLKKSWARHPDHTLKLIAALRDIRDGKGIRQPYHDCLYWLYKNHAKTLYENFGHLLSFGYWKDALQFLMVLLFKGYTHPHLAKDDVGVISGTIKRKQKKKKNQKKKPKVKGSVFPLFNEKESYNRLVCEHFGVSSRMVMNRFQKKQMAMYREKFARERYHNDAKYRLFHVRIAQIFAQQLYDDHRQLKNVGEKGPNYDISLAAKWAPSLEGHFDRYTLISSTIAVELARIVHEQGRQEDKVVQELLTKPVPIAVYLARRHYQKEYCAPLRRNMELPESAMSAGEWDQVKYERVPSKCMQRNSKFFKDNDGRRFEQFLKKPDRKVAGVGLKPLEIIQRTTRLSFNLADEEERLERLLLEKQWAAILGDIKGKGGGLLKSAVAVCNVNSSYENSYLAAVKSLTLITMSLSEDPWSSTCISFHQTPKFHEIPSSFSLQDKLAILHSMEYGSKVDIHSVFELILAQGLKYSLSQDQMPKTVLIFSHMDFNQAFVEETSKSEERRTKFMKLTNFEAAKLLFKDNGYILPNLIFWNLNNGPSNTRGTSTPVRVHETGTILLSGFSAQQMAYVMRQDDLSKCNSLQFILDIIGKDKYKDLMVYD